MNIDDLVHKCALSILWSAGHDPSRSQRISMQSRSYAHGPTPDWPMRKEALVEAACSLLREFGYAPDASKGVDHALPEVRIMTRHGPAAGHAVMVDGDGGWMGVRRGDVLTLSSNDDASRLHIGKGVHTMHNGPDGGVSLSSGGPSSMIGIRKDALRRTDRTVRLRFWRFRGLPEANGGVDFTRPVPVWEWDGDERAFNDLEEMQTCR